MAKKIDEKEDKVFKRLVQEVEYAEKDAEKFLKQSKKILKRYRDERGENTKNSTSKYNVFWSNVETLKPAIYSNTPTPEVERRFKDSDALGRIAAELLERASAFCLENYNFDELMEKIAQDYLIVGRGSAWVRYVPYITREEGKRVQLQITNTDVDGAPSLETEDGDAVPDGAEVLEDDGGYHYMSEPTESLDYEEVVSDYIHWGDFVHSPSRTWEEVRWVARRVYMTKEQMAARFGDDAKGVPLDFEPTGLEDEKEEARSLFRKAVVYEFWDKESKKVYWFNKKHSKVLDVKDDPLKLRNFFPCPSPLLATLTTDSLLPIADFVFYQDQASQLDKLTSRIDNMLDGLKIRGVYDAAHEEIGRLLDGNNDNKLIGIKDYTRFAADGGLAGCIDFMPIKEIGEVLLGLYQAREKVKADLYEITGMSDIVRGYSSPSETATAQQIKGQYANMRLKKRQDKVQRFARDLIAIKAEIIAEHFSAETLYAMTGADFIEDPTIPFESVVELLRNDTLRTFKVNVQTDSTIALDEQAEKEGASEYVKAVGTFLKDALPIGQQVPELVPVMSEMLMFFSRRFKAGRSMEATLETAMKELSEKAKEPKQPSPEAMQAQMDMQMKQQDHELAMREQEIDLQVKMKDLEIKEMKLQLEGVKMQLEMAQMQNESVSSELGAANQRALEVASAPRPASGNPMHVDIPSIIIKMPEPPKTKKIARFVTQENGDRVAVIDEIPDLEPESMMMAEEPQPGMI